MGVGSTGSGVGVASGGRGVAVGGAVGEGAGSVVATGSAVSVARAVGSGMLSPHAGVPRTSKNVAIVRTVARLSTTLYPAGSDNARRRHRLKTPRATEATDAVHNPPAVVIAQAAPETDELSALIGESFIVHGSTTIGTGASSPGSDPDRRLSSP